MTSVLTEGKLTIQKSIQWDVPEIIRNEPGIHSLRESILRYALIMENGPRFDFRKLFSDPVMSKLAGEMIWRRIKDYGIKTIIGPGFGAAPLLMSTALAALNEGIELRVLMVRDKRKEHNRKRWIEGVRDDIADKAIFIDDFMEAGSAINLVEKAIAAERIPLEIIACCVFFDMWQPLGSRQISVSRYPVHSVFSRHDIGLSRDCFDARPPSMKGSYPDFVSQPRWWKLSLNKNRNYPFKCAPVAAGDAVYVADDLSRVWRHDIRSGEIDWLYESISRPEKGIVQQLQYEDRSIVFGCYDGTIARICAETGSVIWRWRQDTSVHATPALDVKNNRIFVNTEQYNNGRPFGHLISMEWSSGKVEWMQEHRYWPPGSPAYDPAADVLVATCNDRSVRCFDAGTGKERWKYQSSGLVRGKPWIGDGRVVYATESGHLVCRLTADGKIVWSRRYGVPGRHHFVAVKNGVAYVMDGKWHLAAFDLRDGALLWLSRLRSAGTWSPIFYGQWMIVLSRAGDLAVFETSSGTKIVEQNIGGIYYQPPCISQIGEEAILVAASNNEGLKAFTINTNYAGMRNYGWK